MAGKAKKPDNAVELPDEQGCYKNVATAGGPHKLNTVASLPAVRAWVQSAMKHGHAYSMWHNAKGSSVKCGTPPRSDSYSCTATGKPCQAATSVAAEKLSSPQLTLPETALHASPGRGNDNQAVDSSPINAKNPS
jgi:hypothetical protein